MVLCLLMLFSFAVPTYATEPGANIALEPGNATSQAVITAEACLFSVTVPSALPISMNSMGEVFVASNAKIVNDSAGPIEVKNVDFAPVNGWSAVAYDKSFVGEQMDLKEIGFAINGAYTTNGGFEFADAGYPIIVRDSELALDYDAVVAPQSVAIASQKVANVVFTIGWYEDDTPVVFMSAHPAEGEPAPVTEVTEGDKATLVAQGTEGAQFNWFNSDNTVVEISEVKGTTSSNSGTDGTIGLHEGEHVQTLIAGRKVNITAKAEGTAIIEAYEDDTLISITSITVEPYIPEPAIGSQVTDSRYWYRYGQSWNGKNWETAEGQKGWGVCVIHNTIVSYPAFQTNICVC